MGPLLALLNAEGRTIADTPVSPERMAELLALVENGTISGKIAKTIFDEMVQTGESPEAVVSRKELVQVTDEAALEAIVDRVLAANPSEVESYRGGKTKLMGFFVGQIMKETRGKANPQIVNTLLKNKLG